MNYTYEHLEEQEEAHLAWTIEREKWWQRQVRIWQIGQSILTWTFGICGLIALAWAPYPKNISIAFIFVLGSAGINILWGSIISSVQEGLQYIQGCQAMSRQSLEDIRRLKREWRGY